MHAIDTPFVDGFPIDSSIHWGFRLINSPPLRGTSGQPGAQRVDGIFMGDSYKDSIDSMVFCAFDYIMPIKYHKMQRANKKKTRKANLAGGEF